MVRGECLPFAGRTEGNASAAAAALPLTSAPATRQALWKTKTKLECRAGFAMALAVTCCWSGDLIHLQRLIRAVPEGSAEAAVAREEQPVLFTRPEAPPGTTAPPCELFITLPSGFELHSCVVASTARIMELYAAPASSTVSALEYCGSSGRGKAVSDTGVYECLVTRQRDTVPGAGASPHSLCN